MRIDWKTERIYNIEHQIVEHGDWASLKRWIEDKTKRFGRPNKIAVLSDDTVWELYGKELEKKLFELPLPLVPLIIPPGEDSKELSSIDSLVEKLVREKVHRRDLLVCMGGGVCCDLGGLLALLYMRGMEYVNVPTSLMAQIDASVGGKVGCNFGNRKNLLGGFYHPSLVLIDPRFLDTLPMDHFRSALAEALKVAIITQDSILFDILEKKHERLFSKDPSTLESLIGLCVKNKLDLLDADPFENDLDRVLNLGHAVAHTLEKLHGAAIPEHFSHGEAVAVGLAAVARYSYTLRLCQKDYACRIIGALKKLGVPVSTEISDRSALKALLCRISEHRGGRFRLVVPAGNGGVEILPEIDIELLIDSLDTTDTIG